MNKTEYIKSLRSAIVVQIKKTFPGQDHRELINEWGYPRRLSKITDIDLLIEIKCVAGGIPVKSDTIGAVDSQGKYLLALTHKAGWDIKRLRALLIKTTGSARWLSLSQPQQRQIIKIVKSYQVKNTTEERNATN
jgi:hypothetical protein